MDQADLADLINRDIERVSRDLREQRENVARTALAAGLIPEFHPTRTATSGDGLNWTTTQDVEFHPIEELSASEGRALFTQVAHALGVEPDEFVSAWDAGTAWDTWEPDVVSSLSMLVPFARE